MSYIIEVDSFVEGIFNEDIVCISINDKNTALKKGVTVMSYLNDAKIAGRFLVVLNDEVIPKSAYENTLLNSGDKLDIMSPISGG
jgi:sulfur carrier protein